MLGAMAVQRNTPATTPDDVFDDLTNESSSSMNVDEFLSDTRGVHYVQSGSPHLCMREDTIMGIDEAGRGPVLG